jgi:Flp pilus assembly pilin Flp
MRRKSQQGQGMVEYALLLALVAVVAIGILSLVGYAAQGTMGLAVGALRGTGTGSGSSFLRITSVKCQPGVKIVVDMIADATISASDLTLRNNAADWFWQGVPSSTSQIISGLGPNYSCPTSVVVQHRKSASISVAGVQLVTTWP